MDPSGEEATVSDEFHTAWMARMQQAERTAKDVIDICSKLPANPFEARARLHSTASKLEASGLRPLAPPMDLVRHVEDECVRARAEFWDQMAEACRRKEWPIDGSTNRRLVGRGLIIELTDDEVRIDEISLRLSPHAASVVEVIAGEVSALVPTDFNPERYMALLVTAYDAAPGGVEKPLEAVYRAAVFASQKSAFWKGLNPDHFVRLTRPAFRARLARLLHLGTRTADGREIRFGSTVVAKDAWEVYSPGEERLVQVGRISLGYAGSQHEH
ncbi:MAG TPA: hypothetical protein VFA20_20960 [Myxococcaceae bacterium]|nr:hypothetical protein [Myxococcaceae bacterium]